jgi:hypothetical protein
MKNFAVLLSFCFLSLWSNAQEKIEFTVADVDRSFTGIQTYKASAPIFEAYYYNIEDGMLTIHELFYQAQENLDLGLVYVYYKDEVLISEIDIKNILMLTDSKNGCTLFIGTKKERNSLNKYMYPWTSKDEVFNKSTSTSIRIKTEEDAKAFIEKLKSMKK